MKLNETVNFITRPTSETFLDHYYTTHPEFIVGVSVLDIGLSDRLSLIIQRKYSKAKRSDKKVHNTIKYRNIKHVNADEFVKLLECTAWDSAFVFDGVNDLVNSVEKMLIEAVDMHIPLSHKHIKKQNQPAWMNDEIINSMRNRDRLLKKARKSNIPANWTMYENAKCKTTNMIKFPNDNLFKSQLIDCTLRHRGYVGGMAHAKEYFIFAFVGTSRRGRAN